jgi:ATP-binding cassette subfamily B protein
MAISKDPPLSVILIVVIPAIFILISIIASRAFPLFRVIQKKIDRLNMVLRESLIGVRVIRAFNKTENDKERFAKANRDLTDTSIKVNKLMAFMMPLVMLVFNLTIIAVIWFGGVRIDAGGMQIGALMAFIQYVSRVMFSLVMVIMLFIMIPRASVSAARINEILEREPDIKDPESPEPFNDSVPAGLVEFRDVSFRYHNAEEPAICHISFTAEPGKVTAIIGGTGSGKSTILNLIPRFYDIHKGSILVGGRDIRHIRQSELRDKIGMVSQQSVLFSGTIRDNIRFGVPDASDETVQNAAAIAQAEEFINTFDKGMDSYISQGGTNVSGGQKQRLAIARALAGHRDIYLFDDSFSALDFKTDARLRKALRKETTNASVIMVSQRVSTVMRADNIIVIEDGRIEGQGTHKELMSTCPVYREIAESQLTEEEVK